MRKSMRNVLLAGAVVAVPAAFNAMIAARAPRAEIPLPGDIAYYDWVYGRVAFYRLGQGPPLLLLHTPALGNSAWEWRKVFPDLATRYTVHALDLLGFGLSDKPAFAYTGSMYADLVHDFLEDVIGTPAHVAGAGLSAAYAVNMAVRRPELIKRLALINPTGTTRVTSAVARTLTSLAFLTPVFGTTAYYHVAARANIERELKEHIYYDPAMVTPDVVDTLYASAHQSGSQYAVGALMAGQLDLPMRLAFADLQQPVMLIWGREAAYTPVSDATDLLVRAPQSTLQVIDACGMLPQDEHAGETIRLLREFFAHDMPGEMAA